jgi:hypothetical protein
VTLDARETMSMPGRRSLRFMMISPPVSMARLVSTSALSSSV